MRPHDEIDYKAICTNRSRLNIAPRSVSDTK